MRRGILKKFLFGLIVLIGFISVSEARGKEGYLVKPTYRDNGDTMEVYVAAVGTTTPVQIFFSTWTQRRNFRESMYQNVSTNSYRVYIGTVSNVNALTGPRWFIPGGGTWTTNCKTNLWAIFERAAFGSGSLDVLGVFERDSLDADVTDK